MTHADGGDDNTDGDEPPHERYRRCREHLWWLRVVEDASIATIVDEVTRRFDIPPDVAEAAAHDAAGSLAVLDDTDRLDLALFLQARENAVTARAAHTAAEERGDTVEAESRRLVAEHFEALAARKHRQPPAVVWVVNGGGPLPTTPQRE